ncbi:conserved repeat domain-containing protein [Pseudobutyrivibrio ruminis]|uniref:Conserved repeat domain-containing protein n=2 Tax=Pseudobutyrivibrio ruminis TaxID=46206 RepID=A0A1H7FG03_9FIRM|nr:conserved repeat domain-containing protein [Pseudobutyrivibrio ruminis]
MKKKYMNIVLALTIVAAGFIGLKTEALADTLDPVTWTVTYDGTDTFGTTYDVDKATVSGAMPGDTITYEVTYKNASTEAANFYMDANVVKTLEDGNDAATGGAYTYKILSDKSETPLFDSETVGGDNEEVQGLMQVNGNEDAYFDLGTLAVGDSGKITVIIVLDGNTQSNSYMATVGKLNIQFAAEPESDNKDGIVITKTITNTKTIFTTHTNHAKQKVSKKVERTLPNGTKIVVIEDEDTPLFGENPLTGDSILPLIFCGIALLLGLFLIYMYFRMTRNNKEVA